jgi:hypothetical protein
MDLAQRGKLLAIFDPYRPGESQPFAFDQIYGPATDLWRYVRPGPVVQVYQISSQLAIR